MERLVAGNLSDEDVKFVTDEFPGMTKACVAKVRVGGINAKPGRTEDCFEMSSPQHWSGLWRNTVEGSEFCADEVGKPATECPGKNEEQRTWFEPKAIVRVDGSLYRVEFIGRRTARPGKFGAYGFFQYETVVDRMISIRKVPEGQAGTK
jgi:hypothetical protein